MKISLEKAIDLLRSENIVAVPTETVYGLAARYDSKKAIHSIFQTKNRPLDHPLIVHIGSIDWLYHLAKNIQPHVLKLIEAFWPGPLTLVLERNHLIGDLITANQDTVAIRMPDHPMLLDLIRKLGKPIVAPSANAFCKTSPTTADHVEYHFSSSIPVLDGGPCRIGIESSIVLATHESSLTLLRHGMLSIQRIGEIAKIPFQEIDTSGVKVPGNKKIHYQPNVPIITFEKNDILIDNHIKNTTKKYFIMCLNSLTTKMQNHHTIRMPQEPFLYAQLLYKKWHSVSDQLYDNILIELPPNEDKWHGIRDRILKAASARLEETTS